MAADKNDRVGDALGPAPGQLLIPGETEAGWYKSIVGELKK